MTLILIILILSSPKLLLGLMAASWPHLLPPVFALSPSVLNSSSSWPHLSDTCSFLTSSSLLHAFVKFRSSPRNSSLRCPGRILVVSSNVVSSSCSSRFTTSSSGIPSRPPLASSQCPLASLSPSWFHLNAFIWPRVSVFF